MKNTKKMIKGYEELAKDVRQYLREAGISRSRLKWRVRMARPILRETKSYEKPIIVKQKKMRFPLDILEASGKGLVCKQCSACHTCR